MSLLIFFCPEIKTRVQSPDEVLVDDPDEMFQLADLLEGVSVDCGELCSKNHSPGINILNPANSWVFCLFVSAHMLFAKFFKSYAVCFTENTGCALHSDKDAGKLYNKDMLKEVGHIFFPWLVALASFMHWLTFCS